MYLMLLLTYHKTSSITSKDTLYYCFSECYNGAKGVKYLEISSCLMCFKKDKPIAKNLLQSYQLCFCGYSGALLRWTCHFMGSSLLTELDFFYLLGIPFYNWNTGYSSSFTILTGVIRVVVTYSKREVG